MRLSDVVLPERVVVPLEQLPLTDAAWVLVERLTAAGAVADPEKLRARVEEGRGEDIVVLGDRAFLTHYRTDAVDDLAVAIGVAPEAIARDLGESERKQARIVLLLIAPPRLAALVKQKVHLFDIGESSCTTFVGAAGNNQLSVGDGVLSSRTRRNLPAGSGLAA